jgi:hypothetical protein
VAKLPDSTLSNIFALQRRLIECLDSTTALAFRLFQQSGETAQTLPELEELQQIEEKIVSSHSRTYNILLRVSRSQPTATNDMLDLLYRSVEQAEISLARNIASLQDIQRNWN